MNQANLSNSESSSNTPSNKQREQYKRLTIDIPASLHRTIKSQCALRGSKIADEIREILLEKYLKPVDDHKD